MVLPRPYSRLALRCPSMTVHKEWWEWLVLCLGGVGGIKAINDLAQSLIFSRPKLRGDVLDKRWAAKLSDALRGSDDRYLLVFVSVSNRRSQKTSVGKWTVELKLADGSEKTIESTEYRAEFWETFSTEYQPTNTRPLDRDAVFSQNEIQKGWLCFPVSMHLEPRRFKILALDARKNKHVVASSLVPVD